MAAGKPDIRIGTSGWHYDHWRGLFYPPDLPKTKWFKFYAESFDTVEINSTFYHQPALSSIQNWYKQAPKDFLYTVKANRFITHIKRLKDCADEVKRLYGNIAGLKDRLGAVLFQLPPGLHKDLDVLKTFIRLLPPTPPVAFEFRHKSWFEDDTYSLLDKTGLAFCSHDLHGVPCPRVITGSFLYIRLHGPSGRYSGCYTPADLKDWAKWIKNNLKNTSAVYVYFNNDFEAFAVRNAKQLAELL